MNHIRTLAPKNLTLEKSINTVGAYSDEHLSVMQKLGLDHKVRKSVSQEGALKVQKQLCRLTHDHPPTLRFTARIAHPFSLLNSQSHR